MSTHHHHDQNDVIKSKPHVSGPSPDQYLTAVVTSSHVKLHTRVSKQHGQITSSRQITTSKSKAVSWLIINNNAETATRYARERINAGNSEIFSNLKVTYFQSTPTGGRGGNCSRMTFCWISFYEKRHVENYSGVYEKVTTKCETYRHEKLDGNVTLGLKEWV